MKWFSFPVLSICLIFCSGLAMAQGFGVNTDPNPPASILHTFEDNANTGINSGVTIEQNGAGDALLQYVLTGGQRFVIGIDNSDADKLKIATDADLATNTVFTIETDGDVGIGTATPAAELDVNGNIRVLNNSGQLEFGDVNTRIFESGTNGDLTVESGDDLTMDGDDQVRIETAGTRRVTVLSTGEIGIETQAPQSELQIGEGGDNTTLIISGNDGGSGLAASLEFHDNSVTPSARGIITYDDGANSIDILVDDADGNNTTDDVRIRLAEGTADILGDGTFTDNGVGPSEWVIGHGEEGDLVCLTGSRLDEDGQMRAVVEPCKTRNSSLVVGVIIPFDKTPNFGNPKLAYMEELQEQTGEYWQRSWEKTHVGIELTGFRMIKVVGPVKMGDLLVSSDVAGHAEVTGKPNMGAIIAKAAQNFDGKAGEKGMIWARVHLQSGSNLYKQMDELIHHNTVLNAAVRNLQDKVKSLEAQLETIIQTVTIKADISK